MTAAAGAPPAADDAPLLGAGPALGAAVLAGLCLAAAFPGRGLWPLALAAPAILVLALEGRRFWPGFRMGLAAGLAFYGPLVAWSSRFLGPVPWAALATVMALSFALGAGLIALATRWVPRRFPGARGRLILLPITIAGLWSLREQIASSWPYGGFAWGRIAQSQSNGPLLELVAWLGLTAMGAVMVWWSALALELVRGRLPAGAAAASPAEPLAGRGAGTPSGSLAGLRAGSRAGSGAGTQAVPILGHALILAALASVPALPLAAHGTVRVAAVQGDTPEAGYFAHGQRGDVLAAHLEATRAHVPTDAGAEVIVWPEGSADLSPQRSAPAARALAELSASYGGIPILANTVTVEGSDPDAEYFNTQFAYAAEGGWAEQMSKKRPVPFGEYIPDREFWYSLAPDLIGLVGRGYSPGTDDAIMSAGEAKLGTLICFDVIEDGVVRQAVRDGAEVLVLPTNNADFDRTDESAQQLAFARLRAAETGMTVIQVSTVGLSAAYDGAGREVAALPWFEPGAMILDAPRASGQTPAIALGRELGLLAAAAGAVLLAGSAPALRRTR